MSEQIIENVYFERGYTKGKEDGFVSGLKRAFELVGELGDFYENAVLVNENASNEEKRLYENSYRGRVNACRYAQHVIRKNSFGDEDLPW